MTAGLGFVCGFVVGMAFLMFLVGISHINE